MLPRIRSLWSILRGRSTFERDMDDELRFHLDRRVEDLMNGGMTRDRAIRVARVEFGNPEAVQDRCRVLHEFTLFDIQARFADVVQLEETIQYLRGQ